MVFFFSFQRNTISKTQKTQKRKKKQFKFDNSYAGGDSIPKSKLSVENAIYFFWNIYKKKKIPMP